MQFVDAVDKVSEDVPNVRQIHTRYGFSIKLERRDPYGFVHVVWPSGAAPNHLSGAYSNFDLARQAVTNYLNSETFNHVVEQPVVYEKAQTKKRAAA